MEPDIEAALQRSFLGRLPRDLVDRLVEGQLRMEVPADTTIYREGEASRAFLVISGLFRLFLVSGDGRQVTIRYGRPPDVLGTALVVGGPLDVRAQTLAPSTILGIDVGRLEEAARRDAAVAYALSQELSRRLDETLQQLAINAFGSVKQRVASQLLRARHHEEPLRRPAVGAPFPAGTGRRGGIGARGRLAGAAGSPCGRDRRHLDGRGRDPRRRSALRRVVGLAAPVTPVPRRHY